MSKIMNKLLPRQTLFCGTLVLILEADAALNNFTTAVAHVLLCCYCALLHRPLPPLMRRQLMYYSLHSLLRPCQRPSTLRFHLHHLEQLMYHGCCNLSCALQRCAFTCPSCTLDAAISPAPLHATKLPTVLTLLRSQLLSP